MVGIGRALLLYSCHLSGSEDGHVYGGNNMRRGPVWIAHHYATLWHFVRNRYRQDERSRMRRYFAKLLVEDLQRDLDFALPGKRVLEVGGHLGEFSAFFEETCGAMCLNLEIQDVWDIGGCFAGTIIGDGTAMPFVDESYDFILCRGVIEHVAHAKQQALIHECKRVLKRGGICLINTQPWYSPFAGHQIRPFHILPLPVALFLKRLTLSKEGRERFNLDRARCLEDFDLYPLTMRRVERMIRDCEFRILGTRDYHTRLHWTTRIPVLREVLTQSITYLLAKD